MSLIKLAIEHDPIEQQHKLAKNVATVTGGILGGFYGGGLAGGKSKKLIEAQNALGKAQEGHTRIEKPSFIKKIFGAKPKEIKTVDNERVNKLSKMVTRLKRVRGVKIGLGVATGAAILGAGMRKMQDVQNNYEVALTRGHR